MAETTRNTIQQRAAERRAILRDAAELARRADAAGLSPIARVLDLAMAMMDRLDDLRARARPSRH